MPRTEKGHMIDHTVTSFLWGSQWPVCRIVQFSWFVGLKNVTNHLHNNKLFGRVILKNPILRATQNTQCGNSPSITGTITGIVYCGQLKINPYFFGPACHQHVWHRVPCEDWCTLEFQQVSGYCSPKPGCQLQHSMDLNRTENH